MSNTSPYPKRPQRSMALTIDSILNECQLLQSQNKKALTKGIESHMSSLNSAFEEISATDMNPTAFQASQAYHNGKQRLNEYINDKDKVKRTLNKEKLRKLLHEETIRSQSKRLTFDTVAEDDLSYLLKSNKRKFGETYKNKGFSVQVSPVNSNLPSIKGSPKVSPTSNTRESELTSVINSLIKKKLGILTKKKTLDRKKTIKVKRKNTLRKKSAPERQEKLEAAYLNPEFRNYNTNLGNKLKVERIVVKHHAKERRASMAVVEKDKIYDENKDF